MPRSTLSRHLSSACRERLGNHYRTSLLRAAFISEVVTIKRAPPRIGAPSTSPRIAPIPGPPEWDDDLGVTVLDEELFTGDPVVQTELARKLDQRAGW